MKKYKDDPKGHIENLVDEYKRIFSAEYIDAVEQIKKHRDKLNIVGYTSKQSQFKGTDVMEREVHRYPETLFSIFTMRLTDEDWKWFDSEEGIRWFIKQYPEFSVILKY